MSDDSSNSHKPESAAVTASYEPTPFEKDAMDEFRQHAKRAAPPIKVELRKGVGHLSVNHPDHGVGLLALMKALGTTDMAFYDGFVSQLANVGTQGRDMDERGINFLLSIVKGIEPRDQLEAMLAAQMAAVHNATMTAARCLAHVSTVEQLNANSSNLNKLARTFAAQLEALKKYRSTGEQKVTVQHVQVNDGGQAIVGNITTGGGGASKKHEPTP